METYLVYSFHSFKGMYGVWYMYIYTSQKFLVLFACLSVMEMEVSTSNIKHFWVPT